jgi:chitodextrinase
VNGRMPRTRTRSVFAKRRNRRWIWFWVFAVLTPLVGYAALGGIASRAAQAAPGAAQLAAASAAVETAAAGDPVVAAAGDIACDPSNSNFNGGNGSSNSCRQKYVSDLLVNSGLSAVLLLGDNQYYCGGYTAHLQSYDLSWGRVKSITRPAPGNHEYLTSGGTDCNSANAGAAGYFKYFGSLAGDPAKGYYSFDIGAWHIIVLNSHCSRAGGCSSSTPQGQWLRNELKTHTNVCTMAYWHVPLFSSGGRDDATYKTFWDALYQYNADLVLNGHDHTYERFAPQTPDGVLDPVRGIREFVVGTGGANHTSFVTTAANSEVRNDQTYGVLRLTLRPTSYDWQFVPEAGKTFTDSGSTACHGSSTDTTPPSTPTGLAANSPNGGKVNLTWNASTDNVAVAGYRVYRNGSLHASVTGATSYTDSTVSPSTTYNYTVSAYDSSVNESPQSTGVSITTAADTTPPTAPQGLSATFVSTTEVRLTWSPSSDEFGIANYRIFRNGIQIATSIMPSYNDTTVQSNTTYTYTVDAVDNASNASAKSNALNVTTPAPASTLTFNAVADTTLRSDLPSTNYGSATTVGIDSSPLEDMLLKFTVSGLSGRKILSAKLRLYCSDPGGSGGVFKRVLDTSWVESTVTWANAPASEAATIATLGSVSSGRWYEVNVTSAVTGDGAVSFRASSTSSDGTDYRSKEGTAGFAPQLVLTVENESGDTTPPTAPANLTASAPNAQRVDLVWTASVDNVAVAGYRIFRNGMQIGTSTSASYADSNVNPDTTYEYYVTAYDAAGMVSQPSNKVTIRTPPDTTPPSAPTNLTATVVSKTRVDLGWGASSDSSGIKEYRVFRDGSQIATSTTTSYSDTTVVGGKTYAYTVSAVDTAGNVSGPSNTATVTTPAPSTMTLNPVADASIYAATPTTNAGTRTTIQTDNDPITHFLLKFTVSGVGTSKVTGAKLRLYNTDSATFGGSFARVADTTWGENTVNWSNAPAADTTPLATLGSVSSSTWYEVDITSLITGDGTYSLRVSSTSSNGADYSSREGTNKPQLVLTIS